MYRLLLNRIWWTPAYDDSPKYLYFDERTDDFEVGCRAQARKHKFEFTEEELEQMKKDYDLSNFTILTEAVGPRREYDGRFRKGQR